MATYGVVLRGTSKLAQSDRRDLGKTNAAISQVLSRDEREPVKVHLFAHGVQCTRKKQHQHQHQQQHQVAGGSRDGHMSSSSSTSSFHVVKAGTGSASSTSERKQSSGSGELDKSHDSTASSGWMTPWRKKRKSKGQADGSDEMEVFADVNIFNVLLAGANGRCL